MNLLPQQKKALTKQLPNKVGALFMKMGTGKTRMVLQSDVERNCFQNHNRTRCFVLPHRGRRTHRTCT